MSPLAVALILMAPAAPAPAAPAEPDFVSRLRQAGPQTLRIAENLGAPSEASSARLEVEADGALSLTWNTEDGAAGRFRFHPAEPEGTASETPSDEPNLDCRDGVEGAIYSVSCWSPSARLSAAVRPPTVTYGFELRPDGPRVVRTDVRTGDRLVFSPPGVAKPSRRGPPPGTPAVLADALRQLAGHEEGGLGGGSRAGGDWYASDLWVSEVMGLDFVLTRTVWPGRGGRSGEVPARWAFDYQGPVDGDSQTMAWYMIKDGVAPFWCIGKADRGVVEVACRPGEAAWKPTGADKPAFLLEPFPQWNIRVDEGPHSPFSSVGTSRLEPVAYP